MIPGAAACLLVGFLVAWIWRDHKWTKAAKKKEVMVVNGQTYVVKKVDINITQKGVRVRLMVPVLKTGERSQRSESSNLSPSATEECPSLADGAALEKQWTETFRGFESHLFCQEK